MGIGNARDRGSANFLTRWWHRRKLRIAEASRELTIGSGPYFVGAGPFIALFVVALIGTFASGFLTYRHILLASASGTVAESVLCKAEGQVNCDAILRSEYSVLFGYFPSAVLGLMGFVFVLWLVINGLANQHTRKIAWAVLVLYFFCAIGFSWYYVYVMAVKVDFICTWCIVVHVVNLVSLVVVLAVAIRNGKQFLLPEVTTVAERTYLLTVGVLLPVIVFLGAWLWEKSLSFDDAKQQFEMIANDPAVMKALLQSSPDYKIPVTDKDPVYGSPRALHRIIFFSDFRCPVCAKKEKHLRDLVDKNPHLLSLVFINYPLSKECNPEVLADLHPSACATARAAYAAYLIGGPKAFWAFSDMVFGSQRNFKPVMLTTFAQQLKLDPRRFEELMRPDSPAARKVEQDIRIGIDLGISATPQVFVEGKRIPEMFQGKYLIEAVEWLIASKSPENKSTGLRY